MERGAGIRKRFSSQFLQDCLGLKAKEKSRLDLSGENGFERAESHRWGSSVLPAEGLYMETFLSLKKKSPHLLRFFGP